MLHVPKTGMNFFRSREREGNADHFFKKRGFGKQVVHMLRLHEANVRYAGGAARGGFEKAMDPTHDPTGSVLRQMRVFKRNRQFVLDPRSSNILPWWDGLMIFALLYVSLLTPFEVGFLHPNGVTPLFIINRVLDGLFFIDMCVQFFVAFQHSNNKTDDEDNTVGLWANTLEETFLHYLKGWFFIDLCSLLPSIFDILPVVLPSGGESPDSLRGLRVVRVLRLLKMVKLIRVSRLVQRWQTEVSVPFGTLTIVQLTVLILMATHWSGCVIGLQASLDGDGQLLMTWFATHGYCRPLYGTTDTVECIEVELRYFASAEWALGLVTGLDPEPKMGPYDPYCAFDEDRPDFSHDCGERLSFPERFVRLLLLLLGALIWSYVIARFVEVIVNANPDGRAFRQSVDDLNRFAAIHGLDKTLTKRLREYIIRSKHVAIANSYSRVYHTLSYALRGEVSIKVNAQYFAQIHVLSKASERLCVQVAMGLVGGVFAPSEYMPSKNLYLLHRGVALYNGVVLGGGKVWGLASLMYSSRGPRSVAIAFTYCEVLWIEGQWLREMADVIDKPTSKRIKTWAVFTALKQHILANLVRERAARLAKERDRAANSLLGNLARAKTISDIQLRPSSPAAGRSTSPAAGRSTSGTDGNDNQNDDNNENSALDMEDFDSKREIKRMSLAIAKILRAVAPEGEGGSVNSVAEVAKLKEVAIKMPDQELPPDDRRTSPAYHQVVARVSTKPRSGMGSRLLQIVDVAAEEPAI